MLAALEKRERARPDVAQPYAKVFAKIFDIVMPAFLAAVRALHHISVLDLCYGQVGSANCPPAGIDTAR